MGLARHPRRGFPLEQPGLLNGGRTWSRGSHLTKQIIAMVLSSPPGAKARECDPCSAAWWVQQKTDSAVATYGLEQFDAAQYWQVAHTAGLIPRNFRVLDCTAAISPASGRVGAHVSGSESARRWPTHHHHLRTLQALGWVTVVSTPDRGTGLPWTYRLTRSPTGSDEPATPLPPSPHPPPLRASGGFQRSPEGHDAFPAPDRRPTLAVGCRCPRARPAARWRPWSGRR